MLNQALVLATFVVGTLHHGILQLLYLTLQLMELVESSHGFVEYRVGTVHILLLRQIPDGNAFGNDDIAFGGLFQSTDELEQRGLAGAIMANQSNAVLFTDQKGDIGE